MEYHERLKKVMREAGVKNKDLIKPCKVSNGAISQWRSGITKPKNILCLAKVLKWNPDELERYLEYGTEPRKVEEPPALYNFEPISLDYSNGVPLISMVQAGEWTEACDPYPMGEGEKTLPCPYPHSENTFAVKIKGDSMYPEFREGMVIFIDPCKMPENKDYCIAKLEDTNEATFKQYVIEDGQKLLKATNPDWPQKYIAINGNCHIVGKLIGVYMEY